MQEFRSVDRNMAAKIEPELFLFLSVDIIGSTAIKYSPENYVNWYNNFISFYKSFPADFRSKITNEFSYRKIDFPEKNLVDWKHSGDEIIFYFSVTKEDEIPFIVKAFKSTLEDWFSSDEKEKFPIKGCAWIGQVPFIDRKLEEHNDRNQDFIGPSIDCGFRIGKYASETEIAISVEVADLCNQFPDLQSSIFFLKKENLKGVFGTETEYPIFIIHLDGDDTSEYKHLRQHCDKTKLNDYITDHYKNLGERYSNMISRVEKNIPKYLENKIPDSEEVISNDTRIKPQAEAETVEQNAKGNEKNFQKINEEIGQTFTRQPSQK